MIKILEEADQEVPDELREMKKRFDAMKERRDREKASFGGGGGRGGGRRYAVLLIIFLIIYKLYSCFNPFS